MYNEDGQCIMCGRVTTNESRVCNKCSEALSEAFEEDINNKTKTRGSRKATKTIVK